MYTPQFPYVGNQIIVSSGRVTVHSYDDFIFLFGKKGVSISSPATFTVDVREKTVINSPVISLGLNAVQSVLLGNETVKQLGDLLDKIKDLSDALALMSQAELEKAIPLIVTTSTLLGSTAKDVKARLNTDCLSKNTFTN
jgi:hypothetical protein